MKIDHLVLNVDEKYQVDEKEIEKIREAGFPYEPKWGKGTKGFKAANIFIGNEYFEMIRLLKEDGGGWVPEWVNRYNKGHRGLMCLMIDVPNLDEVYEKIKGKGISISEPKALQYKWFFNLLTKTMPWRNSYVPFFEGVDFQIGFQQMKDDKSRDFMNQYMVPNSRDNGIEGIREIRIEGAFTNQDFKLITQLFEKYEEHLNQISVNLDKNQKVHFIKARKHSVQVIIHLAETNKYKKVVEIENIRISDRA